MLTSERKKPKRSKIRYAEYYDLQKTLDSLYADIPMERRVRGNSHARCGVGENPEIASKDYLSLLPGAFSSGTPKYEDFRIVLEEIVRICFPNELIPSPYPYAWPDAGELTAGGAFSLAWRCLDSKLCSAEHN